MSYVIESTSLEEKLNVYFYLCRGFSIALLIAYAGLLYALIPLALLIISAIGLARWVAQMPTGMVILNSGL